jgi:hypothetical protein
VAGRAVTVGGKTVPLSARTDTVAGRAVTQAGAMLLHSWQSCYSNLAEL